MSMLPQPYNKSTSLSGSSFIGAIIAPSRGVACNDMNWHEYFTYNPETGDLIWKDREESQFKRPKDWLTFLGKHAGKRAGCLAKTKWNAYVLVGVEGVLYKGHRIIWEMHNGPIPEGMVIDHVDGDGLNNRLSNIRICTQAQNMCNRAPIGNNPFKYKGVSWDKVRSKWVVTVSIKGKYTYVGAFLCIHDAAETYNTAVLAHQEGFARLNTIQRP